MDNLDILELNAENTNSLLPRIVKRLESMGVNPGDLKVTPSDMDVDAEISFKSGETTFAIQVGFGYAGLNSWTDIEDGITMEGFSTNLEKVLNKFIKLIKP